MNTFGWKVRLKFGLLAAAAGWVAGWMVSFPFELSLAWRYVDGNARQLPVALAKGLLVWAGFSLFMGLAEFAPLLLPALLLISPRWIVRWSYLLIPLAPLTALAAIDERMGLLHTFYFLHPEPIFTIFFTGFNFFALTFALVVVWVYVALSSRRLESPAVGRLEADDPNHERTG